MQAPAKPPVLVVDDDLGIQESFDAILGEDYQLLIVDNGRDALRMLRDQCPGLLFLDLRIPGPDGLEVLQCIRSGGISTQVVVITALAGEYYRRSAMKLGVLAYLEKPLDVDTVETITRGVLH